MIPSPAPSNNFFPGVEVCQDELAFELLPIEVHPLFQAPLAGTERQLFGRRVQFNPGQAPAGRFRSAGAQVRFRR